MDSYISPSPLQLPCVISIRYSALMYDPYHEADNLNIIVHDAPLSPNIRGFYQRDSISAIILLNRTLTPTQKRCTLAHELQHHYYTVINNIVEAVCCYRDRIVARQTSVFRQMLLEKVFTPFPMLVFRYFSLPYKTYDPFGLVKYIHSTYLF